MVIDGGSAIFFSKVTNVLHTSNSAISRLFCYQWQSAKLQMPCLMVEFIPVKPLQVLNASFKENPFNTLIQQDLIASHGLALKCVQNSQNSL